LQGTNQARSHETTRRRKAPADHGEASTFAAPLGAMLVQRVVERTLSLLILWGGNYIGKETKRFTLISKIDVFASFLKAHFSHSVYEARNRSLKLVSEWEQKVDLILDRDSQAMTSAQRSCVHILRHVDRIRSARAALTSGLARKAPRTSMESIVSRASSGGTSSAMLAKPSTLISSVSPACRTASRSRRA
jgi:hypothetical protein